MGALQRWDLMTTGRGSHASLTWLSTSMICACSLATVTAAAASDQNRSVEEIVVTARKMNERLQDVPITVTAITGEQLKERGAVDMKDILRSVPGLSYSNVERGQTKYNIRGITTISSAPTVNVSLDDISLDANQGAYAGAFDVVFFDIDRVEVLKGPQGTLYGGSAMGGAIKYISAKPDASSRSSGVAVGLAGTERGTESYTGEGVLNLPLVDDVLAVRGGVHHRHEGGYIDSVANLNIENRARSSTPSPVYTPLSVPSLSTVNKDNYNDSDTTVGRLSLLWKPDPSWSIVPAFMYQDYESDSPPYFFTNQSELAASYRSADEKTLDRGALYSLDISKDWGAVQLTSITGYVDREVEWYRDFSYFVGDLVPGLFSQYFEAQYKPSTQIFSQELRISSSSGSKSRLRWVAGLYYSALDEKFDGQVLSSVFAALNNVGYDEHSQQDLDQQALFGEASFSLTDALDLTAGVRLFKIKNHLDRLVQGPFNGGIVSISNDGHSEDGVNPKVGLSYKLDRNHLLYTSAAKGFRPGGFTRALPPDCAADLAQLGIPGGVAPTTYGSDSVWSYELGSKNEFGDGRVVLNGALFHTDWKDIQQTVTLTGCGFGFSTNVGEARVRGAEAEMQLRLTPNVEIGGNATYTDAKITEPGFGSAARVGDRIQDAPKWMASAYGSYAVLVKASWDLQLRADYQYRSSSRRRFANDQNVTFSDGVSGSVPYGALFQDGYDVVSAFASFSNGPRTFRLYVNNLLDERPWLDTDLAGGVSISTTLRPRTIGFEMRQQF
jgi:iron complex outermembrane recepter protein